MRRKIKILFLDDDAERVPFLRDDHPIYDYELIYVRTPVEFMDYINNNAVPDIIGFDHDLAAEHYIGWTKNRSPNGDDLAEWLIAQNKLPEIVIVHSWNSDGARNIANRFIQVGVRTIIQPFRNKIRYV